MSCGVGRRGRSDPLLLKLWLWCRTASTALIQPLAWETSICCRCSPKKTKKKKEEEEEMQVKWGKFS